jgi:glucose/arabinose dehydrogenase
VRTRIFAALAALLCLAAGAQAAGARPAGRAAAAASFRLVPVAKGLSSPVYVTSAPGDKRLFAVEQEGTIRTVRNGKVSAKPYADLRSFVSSGGERGLLSVAFHPNFAKNGQLYVYFTNKQGNETIWELHAKPGAASVLPGHRQLLEIADPEPNHNGGQLQFGPDGMLYFGDGDGGGGGDQHGAHGNGQNPGVLLGKISRIDVDTRTGGLPYGIPKDNPFVGKAGWRPEIWALGLRNPWRFSFDSANGDLWIGDVGQDKWEEVDHLKHGVGGINFGWNRYEGRHDFNTSTPLAGGQLRMPVAEYGHAQESSCSITGGYVYRGPKLSGLSGRYVYADYCSGKMWTLATSGGAPREVSSVVSDAGVKSITSFGEDGSGILYVCSSDGTLYRFASR